MNFLMLKKTFLWYLPKQLSSDSDSAPAVSLTSDASDELFFTGVWMSTIENQSDPQIVTVQSTSSFVLEDSVILPPLEEEKASANIDDDPRKENILVFDKIWIASLKTLN